MSYYVNVDVYFIVKGGLVGRNVQRLLLRLESTCELLNFSQLNLSQRVSGKKAQDEANFGWQAE